MRLLRCSPPHASCRPRASTTSDTIGAARDGNVTQLVIVISDPRAAARRASSRFMTAIAMIVRRRIRRIPDEATRYLCETPHRIAIADARAAAHMLLLPSEDQAAGAWSMAQIREVDVSAKQRVKQRTKGYQEREPFRQAVLNLSTDKAIELSPEPGESLRKLKLNLARAAKEVQRNIAYGETGDNMIVAWLADGELGQKRRRGRAKKEGDA
jgi:hypothetical protein